MLTPGGKIPSTGDSQEGGTHAAAQDRTANPTHYRLSYSGPERSLNGGNISGGGLGCGYFILVAVVVVVVVVKTQFIVLVTI